MSTFSEQAQVLVLGDRNESYGPPTHDFAKTAKLWSGLLAHKLKPGMDIDPKEAVLMMVALKLSREMFKHKPDNLIDAMGYLMLAEWIETGVKPVPEYMKTKDSIVLDTSPQVTETEGK